MTSRALALAATLSALLAGALTLLPWVSLEARGLPMRWAGLGLYYGDDVGVVPSIQPFSEVLDSVAYRADLEGFVLNPSWGTDLGAPTQTRSPKRSSGSPGRGTLGKAC